MYIKVQTRSKVGSDGKKQFFVYPRLYESYRDCNGKVRQQYLLPLDLDDLPSWKDRYAMCHLLNDMVSQRPALGLEDTLITRKAIEIYHQLVDKGLLGDARRIEEKNRLEQSSALVEQSLRNVNPRLAGAESICLETLNRLKLRELLLSKHWSKEQTDLAMIQIAAHPDTVCRNRRC